MSKNTDRAEAANAAEANTPATTEPKQKAKVVKTDNSKNGYLAARREARAKAKKGAK